MTDRSSAVPYHVGSPTDLSPVTVLSINKEETIGLAGNEIGNISMFLVNREIWTFHKRICAHFSVINTLNINNDINAFISCSYDDYVNVYALPTGKIIHSLKVDKPLFAFISSMGLSSSSILFLSFVYLCL